MSPARALAEPHPEPEPEPRWFVELKERERMRQFDNLYDLQRLQIHGLRHFAEDGRWDLVEQGIDALMD